ncbi:hypothetical protein [Neptuniibacter sp. QD37_11]|uniref:hypothetical protein n=1 Tax=Neptuniibacter sp. QD37_11 TaxID=3398209 RepID=UPI0039F4B703
MMKDTLQAIIDSPSQATDIRELEGLALAYAIAKYVKGWELKILDPAFVARPYWVCRDQGAKISVPMAEYRPDMNWMQCGELKERFAVSDDIDPARADQVKHRALLDNLTRKDWGKDIQLRISANGPTAQVAICRAILKSITPADEDILIPKDLPELIGALPVIEKQF